MGLTHKVKPSEDRASDKVLFYMISLYDIDVYLIDWVHTHFQSRLWIKFMEFVSIKQNFAIPGLIVAILILWVYRWRGALFLVAGGIAIGLNDAISHHVFKEGIGRLRPCHVLPQLQHVVNCSNSFSFPSNHASNTFAFAMLGTLCFRNWVLLVYCIALIVGYSRVFLGVHYPSDILGGAAFGSLMGYLGYLLYRQGLQRFRV
ncbi:MAG: phosphatase PAP2 family protein [Candidatus Nitrohelix vancouverensis]|uniref:Phosphatase PAP2 family protein n=1 Tax=Candidatus Nitrohelix vancouverensis TaxID=2705534 RepID=A0A7T0C2M9_9BACT|nr:MAG: phosphatase PAP2 family protein [Candidatus Nitrohelix vancouverensis]